MFPERAQIPRIAGVTAVAVLGLCLSAAAAVTLRWPLVGDAALMHYFAFLIGRGWIPYRDFADINMPGSWLVDFAVMHTLGPGSVAWHAFDLLLLAVAAVAMFVIARPRGWYTGLFAAALFGLVHLQDGLFETGERDLIIAVLLLVACAALFLASRRNAPLWMALFGFCNGYASAIKPTFLPLGVILIAVLAYNRRRQRMPVRSFVLAGLIGWLLPLLAIVLWLSRLHDMGAMIAAVTGILRYHVSLDHRSLGYLLLHSVSPLLPLVIGWLILLPFQWRRWTQGEGLILAINAVFGLCSWIAQAKGFAYQRYPWIAFLLLIVSIDLFSFLLGEHHPRMRILAWAAVAWAVLVLAPLSAWKAAHYSPRDPFRTLLDRDLQSLGGSALSGRVQCIDSIAGCYAALYDLRLLPATRYLYDEFLFAPPSVPAIARTRAGFWQAIQSRPPTVFVVTDRLFPSGPGNFAKLALWPRFDRFLADRYALCDQGNPSGLIHWWSRAERPNRFRIYCLLSANAQAAASAPQPALQTHP